jgi:hypothetical protein
MGWCKVDLEDVTNVPQGLFDYAIVLHGSHNAALPAIGPPRKSRTDCSSTRLRQWGRGSASLGERSSSRCRARGRNDGTTKLMALVQGLKREMRHPRMLRRSRGLLNQEFIQALS